MPLRWNGHDAGLAPGMAAYLTAVLEPLADTYTVTSGLRSSALQDTLYAQGRTAPGSIVTNARGGQSAHNYGLAIDVYPVVNGNVDYGYSNGLPEPSRVALPAWSALWRVIDADPILHNGRFFSTGYDPGHVERLNWKLFINQPVPAEATGTPGVYTPPPDAAPPDATGTPIDQLSSDNTDPSGNQSGMTTGVVLVALAILGITAAVLLRGRF